jgi:ribonuclease R
LEVAEAKAWVDEAGRTLRLERRPRLDSMSLIEEFMLLGNLLVGEEAERREGPFLYRVHEPPSLGKLAALDSMLSGLGLPRLGGADNVAQALQRLLATALVPEKRRLVHQLTLRSLARAEYREHDVGHFGLAVRGYCHFTSPIRRYPDLFNHRQVKGWLDAPVGGPGPGRSGGEPDLAGLAQHTTGQEQVAQEAERESTRVKALRFFEDRVGEEHVGVIMGVVPAGVFVELEEAPVDGFVRVSSYVDDYFQMDPAGVKLVGRRTHRRFAMGDRLTVRIARVDVPARELELALEVPAAKRRTKGRHGEMTPRTSLAPRERRRKGRRARKDKGRRRG